MDVTRTIADTRAVCDQARGGSRSIGLVPTMGALHEGHESLLRRAHHEQDLVAMSLFVNPLQFGDPGDLAAYPRDERRDVRVAERNGVDLVFAPTAEELLGDGDPRPSIDPGPLGLVLEGAARPGHFAGVATVLARLFDVVGPDAAYFGEKDAQQLAVVRSLVVRLELPIEIVGCPTVREPDGLAMSSRNASLTPEQREAAGCLFLALTEAAELARGGERDAPVLVATIAREIGATPQARLEYATIVDDATFEKVAVLADGSRHRVLLAARFGEARLIDNLLLPAPSAVP
ncbi:MAG: pantoate--beta-alanine ligase [Actinomycetota bacterium]